MNGIAVSIETKKKKFLIYHGEHGDTGKAS
jgi:hypothetical protein